MIVDSFGRYAVETIHDHGFALGGRVWLGVVGEGFAAGGEHGVVAGVTEDVVQLAAAYALVAAARQGAHHGVAHVPPQRGQVVSVAGEGSHPHAVVDGSDGRLGAVD